MKKILILIMLLCGINAMAQENAASLPELQEWYSWKGSVFTTGAKVSYLPGFDSLGGGLNAITQYRGADPVWYNRFPFDTMAQFQWKSGGAFDVYQLDANGDGIADYFDTKGRVYRGIKGQKPQSEPAIILSRGGTKNPLIGDLNNDGYDDVLAYNDPDYFDVILGNKDLTAMKRITVEFPTKNHHYVGGYFSENGKPRILLFHQTISDETFTLYDVIITNTGNQPKVTLEYLHQISEFKNNGENVYSMYLTNFYVNKIEKKQFIISGYAMESKTLVLEIIKDTLKIIKILNISVGTPQTLSTSIDNDRTPDIVCLTQIGSQNSENRFAVFSGNEIDKLIPRVILPKNVCALDASIHSIGDVNRDGIGDIALGAEGCFSVYLGLDWRKVSVNDVAEYNSFKLHQNIPNPIQKDRKTLLPVSLKQQGNYSVVLYSLQGSRIKDLFNGELSEGEHKIPLDLMGLYAGMYIVKMSTGSVSRERAIMIGE
ncbi:MAG: T9SS type A sorting domain-containing protein [Candidatus Kapaibacterium sp.]